MRWLVLVVALATTASCVEPRESFRCTHSNQCGDGAGTCEAAGFCSFDDTTCPSGRRFGEFASEALSNTCVINPNGDFDITAESASNTSITITFNGAPDPVAATQLANYSVDGLTLSGTPILTGSSVTITTSVQSAIVYTANVSGITRAVDAAPLWVTQDTFPGRAAFDVTSATSVTNSLVQVTFQAPPDPATGTNLANYSIPGLTLSGIPIITGNTVTLITSPQSAISYMVTVTAVRRANDTEPLTINSATFTGRTAFNLIAATSLNSTQVRLTFDAAPDAVEATTLANYSIPGLTLSGLPILAGNTVTLTTTPQAAQSYTVTVTGVTRDTDSEPLLVASLSFSGISTFNVAGAAATTSVRITVTFDQAPNVAQATTLANYSVPGLVLSGTPTLLGSTVTIVTAAQTATVYTVTVSNVTRASDGEAMSVSSAMFPGRAPFNVASAVSTNTTKVDVVFDAVPNMTQATTLTNYALSGGLTITAAVLNGSTVTLTTSSQAAISYTVTVSNVTRNSDAEALTTTQRTFTGRAPFIVSSAAATNNTHVVVTFNGAPNLAQAGTIANYSFNNGLIVNAVSVSGNQATLTTSMQLGQTYTVTVSNVTRASDSEILFVNNVIFTGIPVFNVTAAASTATNRVTVTFSAPPTLALAQTPGNYSISGLTVSAAVLSGSTVTLTTTAQAAQTYTVAVLNVTRASDGEPLTQASAMFTGRAPFNLTSAVSLSATSIRLTFDAPVNTTQGMTIGNYAVAGLTLSNPVVASNLVTLTTTPQLAQTYTAIVSNVTRLSDGELLTTNSRTFTGRAPFNVLSVAAVDNTHVRVTFDAAPTVAAAQTVGNYSITGGLTLSGPVLVGNAVTLTTSPQVAQSYTVTVTGGAAGVTRLSDSEPLTANNGSFTGIPVFNVMSAVAITSTRITVTFNGAPDPTKATTVGNYSISGGVSVTSVQGLSGNTVTLNTTAQTAISYTVTVANMLPGVTRAADGEPLTLNSTTFTGRAPFNVSSAASTANRTVTVLFSHPPVVAQAQNIANYTITGGAGLTISAAVLSGSTVTLTTSSQVAITYTVTVANVTRFADAEALTNTSTTFAGRAPFDVAAAASVTNTRITVTFSQAPNTVQASNAANYAFTNGLTASFVSLVGSVVTLNTSSQSAIGYTVTVTGVTRASDAEALSVNNRAFTGRAQFNVTGAASTTNTQMTVTFSHPPTQAAAENAANYTVSGLTLTNPVLAGSTVTLTTSAQTGSASYTVTVNPAITRAADGELLFTTMASFTGKAGFNVSSASSVNSFIVTVTFDAPPNPTQAQTLANYTANNGLTFSGAPVLVGNTVTLTSTKQATQTYTVTVLGVTRLSDGNTLSSNMASFSHVSFNVSGAAAVSSSSITVTFDAAPEMTQAQTAGNYSFDNGLTVTGAPVLSGNTVTIPTSAQAGISYTVTVSSNVTRASDASVLTANTANFTGRAPFNVASATATSSGTMSVTFSHAPNSTAALVLANYSVNNGLTLSNPQLAGSTVTFTTTAQMGVTYTVTVSNVTRQSDAEALSTNNASFSGQALATPTVTNVVIQSTSPDNGTAKYWNTGSVTVVITGSEFTGVTCLSGVKLDDLNGAGANVLTGPTSCTVNSGTQITATFPPGVRTNGTTGWNVKVTNTAGTNTTSTVRLVPWAGLLISEVYIGNPSGGTPDDNEYIELYNPTGFDINVATLVIQGNTGLRLHIRTGGTDVVVTPTYTRSIVPSGGYLLIASTGTAAQDPWNDYKDATFNDVAQLEPSGGVYISWNNTVNSNSLVLDKLGWGGVPAPWFETTVFGSLSAGNSIQRKPGGGTSTTDTDVNSTDWLPQSTTLGFKNSLGQP